MATPTLLLKKQREFFDTGKTLSLEFRRKALDDLFHQIKKMENEILEALNADMRKPKVEAFLGEIGILYEEIRFFQKNLSKWASPRRVRTPALLALGRSYTLNEPLGVILVIGPWNYPFQLLMDPLIGAIAAGNCTILKPSEYAPNTERVVKNLIEKTFPPELVSVVTGGPEATQDLLKERFDHIFYTGGSAVAKIISKAAAENLTPVTLELGGKSPCLVCDSAPLQTTARRIIWGKFFNAGQTCVAPDYVLVSKQRREPLLKAMAQEIKNFFGADPKKSPDYARIINERHFERLSSYLKQGKVYVGGESDRGDRYLAPTLLTEVQKSGSIMADEIFGPILPVLEYGEVSEAISYVKSQPKPLAMYVFTKDSGERKEILSKVSFGGGCVNDTLVHLLNPRLPFGGVGMSGHGRYHGEYSFNAFSHRKAVVHRAFVPDLALRYPPYKNRLNLVRKLIDIF